MSIVRIVGTAAVVAALWLIQAPVHAAACTVPPAETRNVTGALSDASGCFGETDDAHPLSVAVWKIENCAAAMSRKDLLTLRSRLADVSRDVEVEGISLSKAATPEWAPLTTTLQHELQESTSELQEIDHLSRASDWQWSSTTGTSTLQRGGTFLIDYGPIVRTSCPSDGRDPNVCGAAIATAVRVIRVVNLTHILHQCAGAPRLERVRLRLNDLDERWNAYFFKTRSQFIWEIAVNDRRFKGRDDVFAEPPKDQIILAHPGVAYEYVGGGRQNDKSYQPIVMAEVLGYNRFGDSLKGGGLLSGNPALGASIVATYSPDNTGKHVGYGVLFHVNNVYSLGVTRRDTGAGQETTYLLSADFMRIVLKPSEVLMKNFRGAGAPDQSEAD